MDWIPNLIDFAVHLDNHLEEIIQNYGMWTYFILFATVFCETGLVVTPFLPGDSLVFVIGALGANGTIDYKVSLILLIAAASGGNTLNYMIGRLIGKKLMKRKKLLLIKKEHIDKTNKFYKRHGGVAITVSRFLPIVRSFAPFVAGIGNMVFSKFLIYNFIGCTVWVLAFFFGGFFFGNIPFVKNNFSLVILLIILMTFIPALFTFVRNKLKPS
jgi:membrane-associated protein